MKIKTSTIKNKCLAEKYYASIKYMAHALRGEERRDFIKKVCDINIYLGCLCARTCEQDEELDKYINTKIKNYFKPRKVYYYDQVQKKTTVSERRLRSFDIANYLLACNAVGNIKAIHWYIYNHPVPKSILIQLSKEMDEGQLLDLLICLFKSKDNKDKIRGIGSTKNLFIKKNDSRVKWLLKGLWNTDEDAFIQLAYDTGWLGEIWRYSPKRYGLYIKLLTNSNKLLLAINLIEESIVGNCTLFTILNNNGGKQFLFLYFLNKLENGSKMTDAEYRLVSQLEEPNEKIKNYFISFFIHIINGEYRQNINYPKLYLAFKKVYSYAKNMKIVLGHTDNKLMTQIIKNAEKDEWREITELYMMTALSARASFDDFFKKMNYYFEIQPEEIILEMQKYPKWMVKKSGGYVFETLRVEKYIDTTNILLTEDNILVVISDYDYINKKVLVSPFSGNLLNMGDF